MTQALVLDFGGVILKTPFETHALSEAALGLSPGTLTWRGPFDPGQDADWCAMQAGKMTERDHWALRMRETGAPVGGVWTEFPQFVGRPRAAKEVGMPFVPFDVTRPGESQADAPKLLAQGD